MAVLGTCTDKSTTREFVVVVFLLLLSSSIKLLFLVTFCLPVSLCVPESVTWVSRIQKKKKKKKFRHLAPIELVFVAVTKGDVRLTWTGRYPLPATTTSLFPSDRHRFPMFAGDNSGMR